VDDIHIMLMFTVHVCIFLIFILYVVLEHMALLIFMHSLWVLGYTLIPRSTAHLLCMERNAVHTCEIIDLVHVAVATLVGWGARDEGGGGSCMGGCLFGTKGGNPPDPSHSLVRYSLCAHMYVCVCVCEREREGVS
jgi:hypothetical protein